MTHLRVGEICGSRKVTRDDGAVIHDLITKAWSEECIEVDFENIPIASVSFLDQAIGILALDHDLVEVRRKVRLKNMHSFDERLVNDILTSRAAERENPHRRSVRRIRGRRRPTGTSRGTGPTAGKRVRK